MKKTELKALIKKLFIKNGVEENHIGFFKGLDKKQLKSYINENGGFTKGKVKTLSFEPGSIDKTSLPEGSFFFDAILSDENVNMNGYRILLSAWQEGFKKYFDDYEGSVYLQHDMDQPIGKTLSIHVDAEFLTATGFAYDDLTEKRVSRGLITDISTGHIPLEIRYINDSTGEQLTPDEFYDMLRERIDQMWNEGKTREEIKQAIAEMREIRIETHTKVQIVEYSFVSVGAVRSAGVKSISNNTIEILDNELPDEVVIEEDEQKENNESELESEETAEEIPSNNDPIIAEENLEKEGETPEGGEDDTEETPENGEEPESTTVDKTEENKLLIEANALIEQLKNDLSEKVSEIEKLTAEKEELMKFNSSKKKVVATNEVIQSVSNSTKSLEEVHNNVKKLLRH